MQECNVYQPGLRCRGWLYVPDDLAAGQGAATIVLANGFTGVKEIALPDYAERFAAAGFVTLVFDYRYFGESEGEPRSQLFALAQVDDVRNAITWVSEQPEVDPARIGLWGTSYGAGIVVYAATFDKRVKAVVAQVPSLVNPDSRRAMDPERWDAVGDFLLKDRIERYQTGAVNYMKVVAPEGEPCVLPGQEVYDLFMAIAEDAPNWRNQLTVESLEKMREFDPVSLIHLMAPSALLVMPAEKDSLLSLDAIKAAYEKASEPKTLNVLPIGHFEIYEEPWLSTAVDAALDWYKRYL